MWNTQAVWAAGHSVTGGERGGSIRNYSMTRVLWIESPTKCLPDVFMHKAGTRAVFAAHKKDSLCIPPYLHEHEDGSPRLKLSHCPLDVLAPRTSPNISNFTVQFVGTSFTLFPLGKKNRCELGSGGTQL